MKRLGCLFFALLTNFSCGNDRETIPGYFNFANCEVFPLTPWDLETDCEMPSWSPDGDKIIFTMDNEIWSITPTGEELTRAVQMPGFESYPNWYPIKRSDKIVFVNRPPTEGFSICIFKLGADEPRVIESFESQVFSPSFSHDGEKIVFRQYERSGIYTVPATGGEVTQIPNSKEWEDSAGNPDAIYDVQASPSRNVAFYSSGFIGYSEGVLARNTCKIYAIDINGGEPFIIYEPSFLHSDLGGRAAESYNGSTIACPATYPVAGARNLLLVLAGGGEPIPLTEFDEGYLDPRNPSWSPDGRQIAVQMMQQPARIFLVKLKL